MWRETFKNSSIILAGVVLSRFFVFLYNLMIIRQLSVKDYALFSFALSVFNWVLIFSHLDLYAAVSQKISKLRALGQPSGIQSCYLHARFFVGCWSCVGVAIAFFIAYRQSYHAGMLLIFLSSLVPMALLTINDGYFKGFEKYSHSAFIETTNGFTKFGIFGLALFLSGGLELNQVFPLFLLASVIAYFFSAYLIKRIRRQIKSATFAFKIKPVGNLLQFSKWVCYTDLMNTGILLSGNLIVSYYSIADLAQFNLVILIYSVFQIGFGAITTVLIPQVSRKTAKNEKFRLLGLRELVLLSMGTVVVILGLMLFPYQSELIQFLFNKVEFKDTFNYLSVLLIAFPFRLITMTNKGVVQGMGRPRLIAKASTVTLMTNICLFVPLYHFFGLMGAFSAMTCAYFVEFVLIKLLAKKALQQRIDSILES